MNNKEVKEACEKFLENLQANGVETSYMAISVPHESLVDRRLSLIFNDGLNRFEMIGISQLMVKDLIDQTGINPNSPPST